MPDHSAFEYTVVRVAPVVEREEFINAGVILYCRERRFLASRIALNRARLAALAPESDADAIQAELDFIPRVCAGSPEAGEIGRLSQAERFRWLASPRSTVIQVSPVHGGLCDDPQRALDDLLHRMVC